MNEETKELIKWIESKLAKGEFGNKINISSIPLLERYKIRDYFAKDYNVYFTQEKDLLISKPKDIE